MLLSQKALESRSLPSSTTTSLALSHSRTCHGPHSSIISFHRDFCCGSKRQKSTSYAGKVCKGFSTEDFGRQKLTRKLHYRGAFSGQHHLRKCLPRYTAIPEWRFSSSWKKTSEQTSSSKEKAEVNGEEEEEEDWYTRWEKQKLRQYDDFMKKVEHDPYTVLFGKSWSCARGGNIEPTAAKTSSPDAPKESSVPKDKPPRKNWPSNSKPNSTTESDDMDVSGRQSRNGAMPAQEHDQEYTIDPITNRKVLKASAPSPSTFGHDNAQDKARERALFMTRKILSQTPSEHRSFMVEQAKVLSSSNSPSKNPPIKPHNASKWLAQENFGGSTKPKADPQASIQIHDANTTSTATKIESALDRHLSSKNANEKEKAERPHLRYKPKEDMSEDIDLLRTSDVRASAGLRGNPPKETDVAKQARRMRLEESYERCTLDRRSQLAGEAASSKPVQERDDHPVQKGTAPELRFGSWLKETLQDAELKGKDASKVTSAIWDFSSTEDVDPVSVDQKSDSTLRSKNKIALETSKAVANKVQAEAMDKANKLKAQIVPFKAKLDAMKADYDFLRQEWLQEIRLIRQRAARKEEEMKGQRIAKRTKEIHDEEIETQKQAMEAMEMRRSDEVTETAKTNLVQGMENDDAEKPAPRRLQSFLQGEGDMASNVHEFAGRDRWYKRKAPHAIDAKDAEMDAKLQKLARDRALIREVRGIYEDTYGTIDTKHRQAHVCSTSPTDNPVQPTTSSSGNGAPHAQLPLTFASVSDTLEVINKSQITDAQVIVGKLFGELREIQSIVQDLQKQDLEPNEQDPKMPIAFVKSVMRILEASDRLATCIPGRKIIRDSVKEFVASHSEKPSVNRPPLTTAPTSTEPVNKRATRMNVYWVLAYDSASESVKSVEATTLVPFSKEESLHLLDALSRLNNPSKFVPHAISLGNQGYVPVYGTTNILVFKKEANPQDPAEIKNTNVRKGPIPVFSLLDHMPVTPDGSSGTRGTIKEDTREYCKAQIHKFMAEQQKVKEVQEQAVEKSERKDQQVEKASKTAVDGILKGKQPLEGVQEQQSPPSVPPNHTSRNRVHRQERVFSGARRGRWTDNSIKSRRSRRAAGRRPKTLQNMLTAGAFTAACCYCVGVASEMMH